MSERARALKALDLLLAIGRLYSEALAPERPYRHLANRQERRGRVCLPGLRLIHVRKRLPAGNSPVTGSGRYSSARANGAPDGGWAVSSRSPSSTVMRGAGTLAPRMSRRLDNP